MRKGGGSGSKGGVTAYPRQLESLIRLSEAHAKTRLSSRVERSDVREAMRLYREALKQSATDPRTGIVDISILTTGIVKLFCLLRSVFVQIKRHILASLDLALFTKKIKSSLYSPYYAEACNEWRDSSPRLSA